MEFTPITQVELGILLDEIGIAYMESGAYYDSSVESFEESRIEALEQEFNFSHMEF